MPRSNPLAGVRRILFERLSARVFYGWVIVGVAMLVMFGTGPGQSHLIGLFFDPLSSELGLSRTSIAAAYGGATLCAALLLPRMGRFVDRYGPAGMLWLIVTVFGFAAAAFSYANGWLFVAIAFGVLRFLGQGSLMLNCVNMVSQWFERKRGFAIGLTMLGFPISMALHPPLAQWLIDSIGWRETWLWLALSTWVLLLPPIVLLAWSKPEELGLQPDGGSRPKVTAPPVQGLNLEQALNTSAFYIVTASLFCMSMLVTSLHVENKGILVAQGLDAQTATLMFTVTGIVAALSMPLLGHMLDRFNTERMLAGGLIVMSASLLAASLVNGLPAAILYAVIFGINNGVTVTYFGYLWPHYFGRKHLGSVQGAGQMVGIIGASIGPLPLALAIDTTGDYDWTLRALALLPLLFVVPALVLLKKPTFPEARTPG